MDRTIARLSYFSLSISHTWTQSKAKSNNCSDTQKTFHQLWRFACTEWIEWKCGFCVLTVRAGPLCTKSRSSRSALNWKCGRCKMEFLTDFLSFLNGRSVYQSFSKEFDEFWSTFPKKDRISFKFFEKRNIRLSVIERTRSNIWKCK